MKLFCEQSDSPKLKQAYILVNEPMRCLTVDKGQIFNDDHVIGLEFHFDFSNLEEEHTNDYPGLVNMGMTCYMNSYLQTLFHLKIFVREIFKVVQSNQIPTEPEDDGPINGLKCLFYDMLTSQGSVDTQNLTVEWSN